MELVRGGGPAIRVGHRGAPRVARENSLASIAAAAEQGVDAVELDVVMRADGAVVLGHSLAEAEPDATPLDEALARVGELGLGVQLDVKMLACAQPVAGAVQRAGLRERALASSFETATLRALAAADPGLRRAYTYPDDRHGLSGRPLVQPFVRPALALLRSTLPAWLPRRLRALGVEVATLHCDVVSRAAIERCHALGIGVWVWTVDDAEVAEALDRLGADAIITNDPGIFARLHGFPRT